MNNQISLLLRTKNPNHLVSKSSLKTNFTKRRNCLTKTLSNPIKKKKIKTRRWKWLIVPTRLTTDTKKYLAITNHQMPKPLIQNCSIKTHRYTYKPKLFSRVHPPIQFLTILNSISLSTNLNPTNTSKILMKKCSNLRSFKRHLHKQMRNSRH